MLKNLCGVGVWAMAAVMVIGCGDDQRTALKADRADVERATTISQTVSSEKRWVPMPESETPMVKDFRIVLPKGAVLHRALAPEERETLTERQRRVLPNLPSRMARLELRYHIILQKGQILYDAEDIEPLTTFCVLGSAAEIVNIGGPIESTTLRNGFLTDFTIATDSTIEVNDGFRAGIAPDQILGRSLVYVGRATGAAIPQGSFYCGYYTNEITSSGQPLPRETIAMKEILEALGENARLEIQQ